MFNMFEINLIDKENTYKSFGQTEKSVLQEVDNLKQWCQLKPHLPNIEDGILERLLVMTKFNVEKTKRKIDMHYTIRQYLPEIFDNMDPLAPDLQNTMEVLGFIPLPQLTDKCERVCVFKLWNDNADRFQPWVFFKYTFMIGEVRLRFDYMVGEHLIYDLENVKLAHLSKITPSLLKKVHTLGTEGYGLKLHGVHFLNAPSAVETIVSLLKPILKPKIFARVHVHKNLESLHKIIPKDILPAEYGGNEQSLKVLNELWNKKIVESRALLMKEGTIRTDESKRPEKLNDELFGSIHGSFRQLSVD